MDVTKENAAENKAVREHIFNIDDLRLIIERDHRNNSGQLLERIVITSSTGSTYVIKPIGPSVKKLHYKGSSMVRLADYTRTTADGGQFVKQEYIGVSDEHPKLWFFKNLNDETPVDIEHSVMQILSSSPIAEVKVVVDWTKILEKV